MSLFLFPFLDGTEEKVRKAKENQMWEDYFLENLLFFNINYLERKNEEK